MSYQPVSGIVPQYSNDSNELASGYYLKFYVANTTTPLSMATDSTGNTLLVKCKLNPDGLPISNPLDNDTVFIPHVSQAYRLVIYRNEADADANNTGGAFLNVPNVKPLASSNSVVIRVSSRTEMKAYDVPAGYQFSLEEGGRSGLFVVKSGTPPSDPQEGIYVVLDNGNYAERINTVSTQNTRSFGDSVPEAYSFGRDTILPSDTLLLSAPISLENDKRIHGIGGEFTSVLKADADTSVITSSLPTSRTRLDNVQVKGRLEDSFADSSYLVDISDMFISHFKDCHFGYAKNVLRVRGDAGSGSAGATSALFFDNCTFQYSDPSGLLEYIDGQYSVHHNECTFERTFGGSSNAQVLVDSIDGTSGRPFNKVSYNQCHIEECDFTFNAEGCSITDSHIGESSVTLTDFSQSCVIENNSVASVGGAVVDAGYGNKISGVWLNTDFNGVKNAGLPSKSQIIYDSGFNGLVDDEYLIIARKWPQTTTELTDGFFTGQIDIVDGTSTVIESSNTFTVRESSSDPGSMSKITKQVKTYIEGVRIDASGKVDVNNASQELAFKNILKNGTFKGDTITDWLTFDTVNVAAGTIGTSIGSPNATWGIYQNVTTVPGRNYIAVIKGDEGAANNLYIGDAWNGSRGARRAKSGVHSMEGAFYGFIYFEADREDTRFSIGSLSADTFDVKWVMLIDVTDNNLYSSQAPSTSLVLDSPVYGTSRTTGDPIAWTYKDGSSGWVTFGGTYP